MRKIHTYIFITVIITMIFSYATIVRAAMYQNLNPGGDQTIAPASANFESGEAVWVNNTFVVRTRAGGTGTLRNLQLTTGASNVGLIVNSVGNVGIGTTQANNKLNVGGGVDIGTVDTSNLFRINYDATNGGTIQSFIGGAYSKMSLNPSGGNVGIGTTSPVQKLQVQKTSTAAPAIMVGGGFPGGPRIQTYGLQEDGSAWMGLGTDMGGSTYEHDLYFPSSGKQIIGDYNGTTYNPRVTILASGNVGIGTTGPGYKLEVTGTGYFSQPVIVGTPTATTHATTKSYVDSAVVSGGSGGVASAVTARTIGGTAGDTVAIGYFSNDGTGKNIKVRLQSHNSGAIDILSFDINEVTYVGATTDWLEVPVSLPGVSYAGVRKYALDIYRPNIGNTSDALYMRIRNRGTGGGAGGVTVYLQYDNNITFTELSGASTIATTFNSSSAPAGGAITGLYGNVEWQFPISNGLGWNVQQGGLFILNNGNVGIGTTSPGTTLEINAGASGDTPDLLVNGGTRAAMEIRTTTAGDSYSYLQFNNSVYDWEIGNKNSNGNLYFNNKLASGDGTAPMVITNSGSVGIGTTAPGGKLQVVTGSTAGLIIDTSMPTTPHLRIDSANNLVVDAGSSGSQKLYLNYDSNRDIVTGSGNLIVNGNVGIGTTGPGYKLEVTGTGSFSQPVIVGTPTATTHATTKSYVDSMFTGSGQWTTNGGLVYLTSTTQNVGIGTTAIGGKLSIFNNASDLILKLGDNRTAVSGDFISKIAFYDYADTESAYVGLRHNQYNGASPRALAFGVSGNEYMRINNSGNVGIGTTGPNSKLSVMIAGTSGIPALGTNSNGFSIVRSADGVVGMHFGYDTASGNGYIQQQRTDSATAYNLLLQPNGGNVGIATTTPSYKLDVVGGGQFSQPIVIGTPTIAGHAATKSYVDSSVTGAATQWTTTSTGVFYNSGNVGIGTTGPVTKLEIQGTTPSLRVTGASGTVPSLELSSTGIVNWKLQSNWDSASGFAVLQDATERLVIKSGGNVGIGTTNPVAKLEVVGDIQTSNQGRFKGWYTAGSGLAAELGISSGEGFYLAYNRTTSAYSPVNMQAGGTALRLPVDGMATLTNGLSVTTGNVGIATSTPNYSLTVNGYGWFNQPVIVGTPTNVSHAATKNYVDSIIGGSTSSTSNYVLKTGDAMSGNLNMNGSNITAVNKLTVTTIDPLYEIGGVKYSTYASAIAGGVKEEFVGRGRLEKISKDKLQMILDFSKVEKGSDLWVWYNAIDFSKDNVEVLATAYNIPIPIAYTIKNNSIIFNAISNEGIEFSYRLVGKRFDWRKWPTYAKDQNETPSLIVK